MKKFLLGVAFIAALTLNAWGVGLKYYDASQFKLIGKATNATRWQYGRLPDSLENVVREQLWDLGRNSAGLAIRFRTNSATIGAKWDVWLNRTMNHMTQTGIRGLDLYCLQDDGTWTFVNSGRPWSEASNSARIIANMEPKEREYMLYLPLYDGCTSLQIGVDSTATVEMPRVDKPVRTKPIVWYGTSILQGGCASRPGMAVTNIIERRINREVINLGFSGNGQLDLEIARVMANVDAGLYILDFVPNATVAQMNERMEKFYRIIRDKHPQATILFVEDPIFPHTRFDKVMLEEVTSKNATCRRIFNELQKHDKNICLISSEKMLGDDFEASVDAIHFTDLGFMRYADYMTPIILKYLK